MLIPDVGNILHGILRQFGESLKEENLHWADVGKIEIEKRVTKIFDELTPNFNNKILLSSKTLEHQRDRIKKVAIASLQRLTELDRHSKFHPEIFEATFAALSKKVLVYDIDGVKMELVGKIDRIDFSEDGKYFLIIDYKTGTAYLDLWEIYLGVNLQLLTYLMATNNLQAVEDRLPAAMLYYFLKYPTKSGKSFDDARKNVDKSLKMAGFILDDEKVILEIDETLSTLPIKLNKDGMPDKNSSTKVKSEEQFQLLMNYVETCLKDTGKKILSGTIAVEPVKTKKSDACKYCPYDEVCRLDKKFDVPIKTPLDDNDIWKKIFNDNDND